MNVFNISTNPMYLNFWLDSARVCILFNTPLGCKCYHRLYIASTYISKVYFCIHSILRNYYYKLGKSRPAIYCSSFLYNTTDILHLSVETSSDYSIFNHKSKSKINKYTK